MLREYWLNRLAIGCSVAGVLFLVYYSLSVQPEELAIKEIEKSKTGSRITVHGTIEWVHESNNATMFTLFDGNRLSAVMFNADPPKVQALHRGALVRVTGIVQEYRGKLELVAERIKPLKEALSIKLPGHASD